MWSAALCSSSGLAVKAPGCLIGTPGRDKRLWQAVRIARSVAPDRVDTRTRPPGDRDRTIRNVRPMDGVKKAEALDFRSGDQELLRFVMSYFLLVYDTVRYRT